MKILYAILLALLIVPPAAAQDKKETSYERVMRTNTLRCGYINYPPHFIIDPATGKKSGIMHDIAGEMGRLLGLTVEWTEELGWATTVTAIQSGRVDAICTSFWQNPVEGKHLGFTTPVFYSAVGAWVRKDDTRFDKNLNKVNDAAVKVSSTDGAMSAFIAGQDYPKAVLVALPNMTDETQMLVEVSTGKADVAFVETYLAEKYNRANGNKLKNVARDPVRLFGNTIAIPFDDYRLKSMLDSALVQMLNGGQVDRIIKKYEEVPNGIHRVAKPYEKAQ